MLKDKTGVFTFLLLVYFMKIHHENTCFSALQEIYVIYTSIALMSGYIKNYYCTKVTIYLYYILLWYYIILKCKSSSMFLHILNNSLNLICIMFSGGFLSFTKCTYINSQITKLWATSGFSLWNVNYKSLTGSLMWIKKN